MPASGRLEGGIGFKEETERAYGDLALPKEGMTGLQNEPSAVRKAYLTLPVDAGETAASELEVRSGKET